LRKFGTNITVYRSNLSSATLRKIPEHDPPGTRVDCLPYPFVPAAPIVVNVAWLVENESEALSDVLPDFDQGAARARFDSRANHRHGLLRLR
jgi:hypothetical protein